MAFERPHTQEMLGHEITSSSKITGLVCNSRVEAWYECMSKHQHHRHCYPVLDETLKCHKAMLDRIAASAECAQAYQAYTDAVLADPLQGFQASRKEEKVFYEACVKGLFLDDVKKEYGDQYEQELYTVFGQWHGEEAPKSKKE
mmetsp:Transcript_28768/g.72395  ORF Transcript_28768/g.72395 Transcript_28768/m.72395 type:complete len:144 (-) Transcript_28768:38-469(-)|eukprot:CAMPEP_0177656848 /NCGR_PEP_ID=MMETSP0447-20121125/15823_1 /TAXON_ID=0 /ORGANISM="Stygamoeba regulata, Strain BSH-02190019" /LENGTH=143 /DNA_ID=CAMNT_0019161069 /DNA_START=61 /DNA_END=492 /DNA_ORIENTATION=-